MVKTLRVRVSSLTTGDLEFSIQSNVTGAQLFNKVCTVLAIRETWHFGLSFLDEYGNTSWVKEKQKISKQNAPKIDNCLTFVFYVKYYPEDAGSELIEDVTRHQFFVHIKHEILVGNIYCPAETALLLASYALQAQYGDYDKANLSKGFLRAGEYLPQAVIDKYQISDTMWEERMVEWYSEHKLKLQEDAEIEYIQITQDLEQYGVSFFSIRNKNNTPAYLGVDSLGLHIFEESNLLSPRVAFLWGEIKLISYSGPKFIVRLLGKKKAQFYTDTRMCKRILTLCIGNHKRWISRRMPQTAEEQQLKLQAKERRKSRADERQRIADMERKTKELELEIQIREENARQNLLLRLKEAEGESEQSRERAIVAEEKLEKSINDVEALLEKLNNVMSEVVDAQSETEELKAKTQEYEMKIREAELMKENLGQRAEEAEKRAQDAGKKHISLQKEYETLEEKTQTKQKIDKEMKQEIEKIEKQNKEINTNFENRKMRLTQKNAYATLITADDKFKNEVMMEGDDELDSATFAETDTENQKLNEEDHKRIDNKEEFTESSREKLLQFREDISGFQNPTNVTKEDKLHDLNKRKNITKLKTLQQIKKGSTRDRIGFFENM